MTTVRVGYIVIPAAAACDGADAAPATKKAKLEERANLATTTPASHRELCVPDIGNLAEIRAALTRFAQAALEISHSTISPLSVNVDVRRVVEPDVKSVESATAATAALVAFCFVPGVLDAVEPTPGTATTRLASVVAAVPAEQRAALCAIPLPCCVRAAPATDSEAERRVAVHCAVVSRVVFTDTASQRQQSEQAMLSRPILVVGAGGIGCELLKVLVLRGFANLHLVDLDTIDATNLNRQFLFTSADVGHSKAETACAAVLNWFGASARARFPDRPVPRLVPHHDNIKSDAYGAAFYAQFSAVLNALDNVSARQHVNRLCVRAKVPLIESGTMGYNGQVQPIIPGLCECYDCRPKPADQKTFAVCTIHARPTTMVHCVHYAKELYTTLFATAADPEGDPEADVGEPAAETAAGGGGELQYLRDMVRHWRGEVSKTATASTLHHTNALTALIGFGEQLVECLYVNKVKDLLAMKASWSTTPPEPLTVTDVRAAVLTAPFTSLSQAKSFATALTQATTAPSVNEDVQLFIAATAMCAERSFKDELVTFGKEDDAAVQFVAAAANLRAHVFHIAEQDVESLRTIAGAIVPAIATTNAMAGAGVVQQLERILSRPQHDSLEGVHMIYIRKTPQTRRRRVRCVSCFANSSELAKTAVRSAPAVTDHYLVHAAPPSAPAEDCKVCQRHIPSIVISLNLRQHTLGELATTILEGLVGLESVCISQAASIIYEEDFESLRGRTLYSFVPAAEVSEEAHNTQPQEEEEQNAADAARATPSLLFVVDALNREVEWELELRHAESGVVVEGVEAAKATEAQALLVRDAQAARALAAQRAELEEVTALRLAGGGATADEAVVLKSDSDEDVMEIVESATAPLSQPAVIASGDSGVIEIE